MIVWHKQEAGESVSISHILIFSEETPVAQELVALLPPKVAARHVATTDALQSALKAQESTVLVLHLAEHNTQRVLEVLHEHGEALALALIAIPPLSISLVNRLLENRLLALINYPFRSQEVEEIITSLLERTQRLMSQRHLQANLAEVNRQLNQRLQEINTIFLVGKSVTSSLEVEEILERIVMASLSLSQAEEGFILLQKGDKLYLRVEMNMNEEVAQRFYVEASDPIAQQVIQSGQPVVLHRPTKIATGYLVRSLLYLPIRAPSQGTIGVLGMVSVLQDRTFTDSHVFTLSAIADFAAIALENARLFATVEAERSRLGAILEHAAEAILVTDMDNRLWLWNKSAAENFGIAPNAQGQPLEACLQNAQVRGLFAQGDKPNGILRAEVELENGRVFNAQLSSIGHVGRLVVMQDISHLKELDRLKSEFVSTLSHDLRTPLTTIQGYIELLGRVGPLTEIQKDFIGKALHSLNHITALISDLLDIGRIEAGYDLEMQPIRINETIQQAIEAHAVQIAQAELNIYTLIADKPLWVMGNPRRLYQVVENLISNAIKYNKAGGFIKISAQSDDEHLIISIEDNGIGIPLAEQPKIFERFYRVQSQETGGVGGTGLGLAIVKSIIEKHNGRVWVRSYPGKGSTFSFVLPLCEPPAD